MRLNRKKVKMAMVIRDMDRKTLSKISGVSVGTITNIRNGKSCSYLTAQAIANALQYDLEELAETDNLSCK